MSEILKEETNLSEVEKLFAKKFTFEKNDDWELPPLDVLFKENSWRSNNLVRIKVHLNNVKTRLTGMGDKWHQHTSEVDKSKKILKAVKNDIEPVLSSNAWCKFVEVLCTFPLICRQRKNFHSLHLCEAPGGFISALNYYLCLFHGANFKWKWYANTLNPYYEGHSVKTLVVDDRLLLPTIHQWYFGSDNTGDITSTTYQSDIVNIVCNTNINMVTSDGGVDCSDHLEEQELFLTALKFSEVIVSLENLCTEGCCVLKRFTLFECISVCTMYLLNCLFHEVHVFKPATSKAGNSEIYVICLGYIGRDKIKSYTSHLKKFYGSQDLAMFPERCVPVSFMRQLEKCCKMFTDFQIEAILENIDLFFNGLSEQDNKLNEIQDSCTRLYFQKYFLKPLDINQHYSLLGKKKMRPVLSYWNSPYDSKTIYYKITNAEKQGIWEEHLRDIERRLNECFPEDQTQEHQVLNTWHPVWKEIRNRKHAYDQNWITLGKSFSFIMNSKFCNPMILFLWNEISSSEQIQSSNYCGNASYIWEWDSSQCLVKGCDAIRNTQTLITIENSTKEDNPILMGLNYLIGKNIKVIYDISFDKPFPCVNHPATFVLDTSIWFKNSLNPEIFIMKKFLVEIHRLIQVLETNDCLIIILQSHLTRFTVGVLYMVLSFFSAVSMLPPLPNSSLTAGVVWVLSNFQKPSWSEKIFRYMKEILQIDRKELVVVEVVPLTLLFGSRFFDVLVDLNNRLILQKLRSLIAMEKMKIQTNVNKK